MFVTIALFACILALLLACVLIYKLLRTIDKNQKQYVDILKAFIQGVAEKTVEREGQHAQVVSDLERAVELLHEELEKKRTDGGKNN